MKKESLRLDLITRKMLPKKQLIRIVNNKDQGLVIDTSGKLAGRGAYISLNLKNIEIAQKKKVFEQAFKVQVSKEFYQKLYQYMEHQIARNELFRSKK